MTSTKHQDLFENLRRLIANLEQEGQAEAARELRDGIASLNGLTDGWAVLMESIDRVLSGAHVRLSLDQERDLSVVLESVRKIVFRQ